MSYLHDFASKRNLPVGDLNPDEVFSIFYHNIFEYPLTFLELVRWKPGKSLPVKIEVEYKNSFYFIKNRGRIVFKRILRNRASQKKIKLATKASKIISLIPSVRMVGITGSLAMQNADEDSDIDLMIITKNGKLWSTRIAVYLLLKAMSFSVRRPGRKEHGELCLNMWLDESDLVWGSRERNFFTAHEILQIMPLINRDKTYERFLKENMWALSFWPNATEIRYKQNMRKIKKQSKLGLLDDCAYRLQVLHMKDRITKEIIKPTRAIFHPNNLSKVILNKLGY